MRAMSEVQQPATVTLHFTDVAHVMALGGHLGEGHATLPDTQYQLIVESLQASGLDVTGGLAADGVICLWGALAPLAPFGRPGPPSYDTRPGCGDATNGLRGDGSGNPANGGVEALSERN